MKLLGFGSNLQILQVLDKQINLLKKIKRKEKKRKKDKHFNLYGLTQ